MNPLHKRSANSTRSMNRRDSVDGFDRLSVQAGAAMEPGLKKVKTFGANGKHTHLDAEGALKKHGYVRTAHSPFMSIWHHPKLGAAVVGRAGDDHVHLHTPDGSEAWKIKHNEVDAHIAERGGKKSKFSDEKPHILGDAPAGMDKDHHAVLSKHKYVYTGQGGHKDVHFYKKKGDPGRTAQYNAVSKKTTTTHSHNGRSFETISGVSDHKQLDQKLGYGHDVSDEVARWKRG